MKKMRLNQSLNLKKTIIIIKLLYYGWNRVIWKLIQKFSYNDWFLLETNQWWERKVERNGERERRRRRRSQRSIRVPVKWEHACIFLVSLSLFFLWFLLFSSSPLPLVSVLISIFKTRFYGSASVLNFYFEILGSISINNNYLLRNQKWTL